MGIHKEKIQQMQTQKEKKMKKKNSTFTLTIEISNGCDTQIIWQRNCKIYT